MNDRKNTNDIKNFIPCDPALNLCRDCSKKIAEGTCPKLSSEIVKRKKE